MTPPKELNIIENVPGELRRHGFVAVTVFITEKQYADVLRLNIDLTAQMQSWLNGDIAIIEALVKEENEEDGLARLGALFE